MNHSINMVWTNFQLVLLYVQFVTELCSYSPWLKFDTFQLNHMTDYMKPDTETYNWVIQAYTRAESYDRYVLC